MMDENSTNINITTITFQLKSLNIENTRPYDVGNSGPNLVQTQIWGGDKPVNWIPTLLY